jgi:hypothetical protein
MTHGHSSTDGQGTPSPTYVSWQSMWARCARKKHPKYSNYGGRGIRVCERWRSFSAFLGDMGLRPDGMTLDRIEASGNYEPGNCRWATNTEQNGHRSSCVLLTFHGDTRTIAEWGRRTGIAANTIRMRLKYGWSPERALSTDPLPPAKRRYGVSR